MTILSTTQTNAFQTGNIEHVTVGVSGYYDITAFGAEGGAALSTDPGLGAMASGDIYLSAGARLEIVVGGQGASTDVGGGGGGGSFVIETFDGYNTVDLNEVIAGGGGGAGLGGGGNGGGGQTQAAGGDGGNASGTAGAGGVNGAAGHGGTGASEYSAGGGGGFTGGAAGQTGQNGSDAGNTFDGGGGVAPGGLGGGGGGSGPTIGAGGGGGGYGGGGGGTSESVYDPNTNTTSILVGGGGGGGSFVSDSALDVSKTASTQSGNGEVTIDYVTLPSTVTGGTTTSANTGSTADMPFAGVTVGDINVSNPTDTLTITLSDPNATLSVGATHPSGVTFSSAGGGVYHLTGSAVDVTGELDALKLNAPSTLTGAVNGVEALTFSLSDNSNVNATAATDTVSADILGPNFAKTFGYTGHIETFTVQTSGYYDIGADGAQGGAGVSNAPGGLGAEAGGEIYLNAGATLELVVGGVGEDANAFGGAGGGGGGSFVIEVNDGSGAVDINEVIAGGGGGSYGAHSWGAGGRTQATGGNGNGGASGGVDGAAGKGNTGPTGPGGGGGGFTGGSAGQSGGVNGVTFAGGAVDPSRGGFAGSGGAGGFGGGGGGSASQGGGGGGGGYGGGGGGYGGGGGGSFLNSSTVDPTKTAATHSGAGSISIAAVQIPPTITGGSTTDVSLGSTDDTPFAGVAIGDLYPGAADTLTITLSDQNASLSVGASHPAGVTFSSAGGVYTLTGSAVDVTSELDALTLNAPTTLTGAVNNVEALTFSLADKSNALPSDTATATVTADIVGANFAKTFGYSGHIETFTVQTSGYYEISAGGAQGGGSFREPQGAGGLGALASGDVYLQAGAKLEIVVGGAGGNGGFSAGGGGGGGSYVIEINDGSSAVNINEVIAGGGGGAFSIASGGASRTQASGGGGGSNFGGVGGAGGANGAAGQHGTSSYGVEASGGGGGGGFTGGAAGQGGSASGATFAGGQGGKSIFAGSGSGSGGDGGFGGGAAGAAVWGGGGGGGGYGGGGGGGDADGGGGGSFVNSKAVDVSQTAATQSGNGFISITAAVAPTITGGSTTNTLPGLTTATPFAGVTITDANSNNPTETLTITLSDHNASLSLGASQPAGVTFSFAGNGVYHLTGSAVDVTSELDALTLNAPSTLTGAVDGVEALTLSLSDQSSADPTATATGALTANISPAAPTIAGGSTTDASLGSTTDTPFAGVAIGDANPGASETLTITLSDLNASLSLGASQPAGVTFTSAGGGVYHLTGLAGDVTSELDDLLLSAPSALSGAVNGVEALTISLSDKSSANLTATATGSITVDIRPILPAITGGTTTHAVIGSTTDTPFAGVTLGDANPGNPTDTLTIVLSDPNASLSLGASQPAGVTFVSAGSGVYHLTGLADDVTKELDALTLNAPSTLTGAVNGVEALSFSLTDRPSVDPSATSTASITANIVGPNGASTFGYTGHIDTFTVATAGYYHIEADGAQGGALPSAGVGGLGAMASGDIYLAAGAKLEVVVGGQGGSNFSGGGGGGSFVIEINDGTSAVDINKVIAGGGGGAYIGSPGGGGLKTPTGGDGGSSDGYVGGAGGVNGAAGGGGTGYSSGGGGGGFTGGQGGQPGSVTGVTFDGGQSQYSASGGFGGGGAGGSYGGGGGGGGYGGGGGGGDSGGGGGGSFVDPNAVGVVKTAATRSGDGFISIAAVAAPTISIASPAAHATSANIPVDPFAGDVISDANSESETLTVTPSTTANGALSDPNSATDGSSIDPITGTLSVVGTAQQVAAALDGLVFTPAHHATSTTTTFTIAVQGANIPFAVSDSTTTVVDAPCYRKGTRILTARGAVAIETLAIGDLVVTAAGERRPIKWIGRREVDCYAHPEPEKVWPVRIAAGAVAPGVPLRDLYVSPDHCILFDDVLVVARLILNGSTIVQEQVADVSYWHVELDSHDAILAEGLAAESYLDCSNRHNFANGGAVMSLHPHFELTNSGAGLWAERSYAPHIPDGPRLAALRGWLGSRADHLGAQVTSDPDLQLYADGDLLTPVSVADNRFQFDIPESTKNLRLRSRAAVPRHVHRLNNADDRLLGVSVRRIEIDGQSVALDHPGMSDGWQAMEGEGAETWRWTGGDAALPVGRSVAVWINTLPSYPLPWRRPAPAIREWNSAPRKIDRIGAA